MLRSKDELNAQKRHEFYALDPDKRKATDRLADQDESLAAIMIDGKASVDYDFLKKVRDKLVRSKLTKDKLEFLLKIEKVLASNNIIHIADQMMKGITQMDNAKLYDAKVLLKKKIDARTADDEEEELYSKILNEQTIYNAYKMVLGDRIRINDIIDSAVELIKAKDDAGTINKNDVPIYKRILDDQHSRFESKVKSKVKSK